MFKCRLDECGISRFFLRDKLLIFYNFSSYIYMCTAFFSVYINRNKYESTLEVPALNAHMY